MNKQKSSILTFDKCIKSVHIQGTVYDGRQQAPCSHMWKEKEAPSSVSKVSNNTRYEYHVWLNSFKWSIDLTLPNKSWAIMLQMVKFPREI